MMKIRYSWFVYIGLILAIFLVVGFFLLNNTTISRKPKVETEGAGKNIVQKAGRENSAEPQLYLSLMTHMELGFSDDKDEKVFLGHVDALRYGMDLADKVGAKLTVETEKPFARANVIWNVPIMEEIHERGHGVQTHCDLGKRYTSVKMSSDEYARAFRENKKLVDGLVGSENNIGCSGGPGVNDWVTAASKAGFVYINGLVGGHLLPIPFENRPSPKWTDEYVSGEGWHHNLPENIYERIYPIPLADINDLEADEDSVIIVMPGTIARLDNALESEDDPCIRRNSCPLTEEDVDAVINSIRDVSASYDSKRGVGKMTIYIPVSLYNKERFEPVLNYFFSSLGELEKEGLFTFGTHKEIFEHYIATSTIQL